ncbi:hypothetical protein MKX03_007496 [Papaver bracteatum]|nr:hypothetical protein MKX03_007496 [Papaver bracteatum]
MEDQNLFNTALQIHLILSPITLLALLFIQAPYGKHYRGVFFFHYIHRTLIYPIRLTKSRRNQNSKKPSFPISVVLMAFVYNLLNVYLQSRWVSHYADGFNWFILSIFSNALIQFWMLVELHKNLLNHPDIQNLPVFYFGCPVSMNLEKFRDEYPKKRKALIKEGYYGTTKNKN